MSIEEEGGGNSWAAFGHPELKSVIINKGHHFYSCETSAALQFYRNLITLEVMCNIGYSYVIHRSFKQKTLHSSTAFPIWTQL